MISAKPIEFTRTWIIFLQTYLQVIRPILNRLIILFCIILNLSCFQYSTIEMQYLLKNRFFTIFETIVELKYFTWNIFGVFHSFFFTILFFILTLFNYMVKIICDFFSNYNVTSFFHKLYFVVVICILILVWNIDIYL